MSTTKPDQPLRDVMDLAMCTCANLRKTTRAVTQLFDTALKPSGLTASQFTLLAALARRGAIAQSRLAEVLVMERTTLIRNLKPLIAAGLVATESTGARGLKTVSLTEKGEAVLSGAVPRWQRAQTRIAEALGAGRWDGFIADLESTVEAAHRR